MSEHTQTPHMQQIRNGMAARLTYEELSQALRVEDGVLIWRVARGCAKAGAIAGRKDRQGYVAMQFKGAYLLAHRVVWLLTYGSWPEGILDHKDCVRHNNHPRNLRLATPAQNRQNSRPNGELCLKGVSRKGNRFQAICDGLYLGMFSSREEAARAYDKEALRRYGNNEFVRINFGATP